MRTLVCKPSLFAAVALCLLANVACDELPTPPTSTGSASATVGGPHGSNKQPAAAPKQPVASKTFVAAASKVMDHAEAYTARCWVVDDFWDLGAVDRCWPKGKCSVYLVASIDEECGYDPAQPKDLASSAKMLALLTKDSSLPAEARVFVKQATMFAQFVTDSQEPDAWCLENAASVAARSECWARTQGTTAYYQRLARAWNNWRPSNKRLLVPQKRLFLSGGRTPTISKQIATEGFDWGDCPDGPCLVE